MSDALRDTEWGREAVKRAARDHDTMRVRAEAAEARADVAEGVIRRAAPHTSSLQSTMRHVEALGSDGPAWMKRAQAAEAERDRLREALTHLADVHHRTLIGSRKHDPENREWHECDCRSCTRARAALEGGDDA